MRREHRRGFTLVELLVVIGILAVLIGVLLPALAKARQAGLAIKCAANLHSVGQALSLYCAENKGAFPASYTYVGQTDAFQSTGDAGYIHWTGFLYKRGGNTDAADKNSIYWSLRGWEAFQCPAMTNGGLPPTNTYDGNWESGQDHHASPVVDYQAPRCAYTANEAVMPRNKFNKNAVGANEGSDDDKIYKESRYVKFTQIKKPNRVIVVTEFIDDWRIVSSVNTDTTDAPCKSHRPVNAFVGLSNPSPWANTWRSLGFGIKTDVARRVDPTKYQEDKDSLATPPSGGGTPHTLLSWVGRNHGSDFKTARTNFLYADGHVETKRIEETLNPVFEWGSEFYSLKLNGDVEHSDD